jgi:urease
MRILPREQEKVLLHQVRAPLLTSLAELIVAGQIGFLAQKRLARGVRLNQTEATALIASVLQERMRDGEHSVSDLMQHGKTLLGRRHVLPGVPSLLHEIQVEGTFNDG